MKWATVFKRNSRGRQNSQFIGEQTYRRADSLKTAWPSIPLWHTYSNWLSVPIVRDIGFSMTLDYVSLGTSIITYCCWKKKIRYGWHWDVKRKADHERVRAASLEKQGCCVDLTDELIPHLWLTFAITFFMCLNCVNETQIAPFPAVQKYSHHFSFIIFIPI